MKTLLLFLSMLLSSPATITGPRHPIQQAYEDCVARYQNDPDFAGEPGPGRTCEIEALRQ